MKKNKKTLLFLLAVTALGIPGLGKAQAPAESSVKTKPTEVPAPAHFTRKEDMEKLQVTKDQRHLLLQNRASYRKKIALIEGQFKVKKGDLENEIEKPEPDEARIEQLTSEIG